ncbi:ubiquinone biosynthesis protein Coq9 (predicted) [Sugiyamaella lignohabitans]|uniref:Ubiquinone biosynthesis protein n=1 Tax=Sugiyamaella lignohabitans TaxID=796027 RepID=A0A167CEY2_9ASCO|nr:ubiquinone biosynthesis protein Coq9 (predicted) [Sugiyamaella lignohabitans]ANB11602.1 ubiquinone biosynthesis protein Coq9 (predicted) [Sugiyamaella lignohabitans]
MFARRLYSTASSASKSTTQILDVSLKYVPELGFENALVKGIRELGYSDAAHSVFPQGTFNLVQHHLKQQRLALSKSAAELPTSTPSHNILSSLVKSRLRANIEVLGSPTRLSEAISIMTLPSNLPGSLEELHSLSDEIMYLAHDRSTGFDWYTNRGSLSAIYASSGKFRSSDSVFSRNNCSIERRSYYYIASL